jgi:hypothetical protein
MQEYQYTNNGTKIIEWIPTGIGCGKRLSECLAEAKGMGLTWDDNTLPEGSDVPKFLANWRVKAVLDMQGLTPTVDAAIEAMPDGMEKIVVSRAWNGNGDVLRYSPTVTSFMSILGLTEEQVDEMFRLAASFNP